MNNDVLKERPALFLGSRLKRLAERMQGDVSSVGVRAGVDIQPSQYSLLASLDRFGPKTIGELAEAMELSQPAVTRMAAKLARMGLVSIDRLHEDQRHKTVALTERGSADLERSKLSVWPQVEAAVNEVLAGLSGPFLEQIDVIERLLAQKPLNQRAQAHTRAGLMIREFSDELAPAFREINTQWIQSMYELERADLEVLENPRERIIDKGGDILFVEVQGLGVVGTCALRKTGEHQYELTKMGVLESARGRKAGEFLLEAVIARAGQMGAKRLYLLSNRKSSAAIHLYEKLGFRHDADIMREFGARYERCDVAMLYQPQA
ncbi:MAG TPA: GNAT family N-acetyltransferase [Steroidobacteraceae bacterium]|nr:GNAT family N-acetyltransferase [Steroidobacteraceae bacterium]